LYTLENVPMQSHAAKSFAAVQRSVVRVRGRTSDQREDGYQTEGVGSGVVIVDTGIILTNLHVVNGADSVTVEFFDGMESEASGGLRGGGGGATLLPSPRTSAP